MFRCNIKRNEHYKAELIGFNMMYKILKLDENKWTKFEFIHYYPGKFSLYLILLDHLGLGVKRKSMSQHNMP